MCLDVNNSYITMECGYRSQVKHNCHTFVIMAAYNCHARPYARAQESAVSFTPPTVCSLPPACVATAVMIFRVAWCVKTC
jgi:hypothetical protein